MKRELQKHEMKQNGQDLSQNIKLPQYQMNQDLKVYEEVDVPPSSIYKAVGYNDMQRVKIMVEGDDAEKRSAEKKISSAADRSKSIATKNREKLGDALALREDEQRKTEVTNLHYRKFYEDELENDKGLFPDPDEPFIRIPIKRG